MTPMPRTTSIPRRWRARSAALLLSAIPLSMAISAHSAPVTVSASFDRYVGNVQSGPAPGAPDFVFRSRINGVDVGPSQAIPGQESNFVAADPNDPSSQPSGTGYADVDLGGASSVSFVFATSNSGSAFVDSDPNLLQFTPGPAADVVVGQEFLLGTITFQNGNWFIDDRRHRFDVTLTTHSTEPTLDGHTFKDVLELFITPNCFTSLGCFDSGASPETNADQYRFVGRPALGAVSVYELLDSPSPAQNRGSVQLFGRIGSLNPTRFANATGGAILGAFDPSQPPNDVPAPASMTFLGIGGAALLALRRRGLRSRLAHGLTTRTRLSQRAALVRDDVPTR